MQVPAQFAYERAESVAHALALLEKYGPEARVVAGGHSLIPMMKLRLAQPEALIDINGLDELAQITVEGGELVIGSMVRHSELLASTVAGGHAAVFHDAFAALRATAVIRGADGTRAVAVREFHEGPYETVVGPEELLVQLRVPDTRGAGSAYVKVERRIGDWAVAAAAAVLRVENGLVAEAGLGLTAVGAPHFCAPEAEAYLIGRAPTEESFAEAGRIAAEHCDPQADQRGPADYKRHLAGELTRRALVAAAERI